MKTNPLTYLPSFSLRNAATFVLTISVVAFISVIASRTTQAATFTLPLADDAINSDSICNYSEAVANINDGAQTHSDCVATGDPYGINDTVILPAGTITFTTPPTVAAVPIIIRGQGMGVSIIDGDGQYSGVSAAAGLVGSDFTVTAALDLGIQARNNITLTNIEIDGANWGVSDVNGVAAGIVTLSDVNTETTVTMSNIYVHNFNLNVNQIFAIGVSGGQTDQVVAELEKITIADITNVGMIQGLGVTAGLFDGGASSGPISAQVSNITIHNLTSQNTLIAGILLAGGTQSTISNDLAVNNATITSLAAGGPSPFLTDLSSGAAIAVAGGAVTSIENTVNVRNLLAANNNVATCGVANINAIFSVSGIVTNTINSLGGNVADTNTCVALNNATDQNNITNLAASLGQLTNNGGSVPTRALLEGSQAIDAGVAVSGLSSDARGFTRPQGNAFDSGAYESSFTKASQAVLASTGSNQLWVVLVAAFAVTSALVILARRKFVDGIHYSNG